MKRFLAILLAATLLLSLAPATSMAATQYATVTGGWLRLRAEPNFNSNTITSYYTGTQVKILGTSGSWYHVEAPDRRTGYMYGSYLSLNGGGGGGGGEGTAVVTSHNGYGVRLRTGPGTGYRIIRVYPVGTPATVLQRGSYWSKLNIAGTVGYMMNQFLNFGGGGGGGGEVLCYATIWSRNGYGVRLRTGPGKGYGKIGVYSVGTTVAVLEKGATWDRIRVGSRIGWMMNEFLNYYSSTEVTDVRLNNMNPVVGNVLAVQGLTPSQATVSYSWLVGGVQKGTAPTYTVDSSDIGKKIQLKVTGTGSYTGSATSPETNAVVSNTQIVSVTLNNKLPVVGDTLTAAIDPAGAKVIYAWKVGGLQVSNAESYKVKAADVGKQIELVVTGTGVFTGWASSGLTQPVSQSGAIQSVGVINLADGSDATVTSPNAGDTLKANLLPATATASYVWTVNGTVAGTSQTFPVTSAHNGKTITLTVTGTGSYTGTITKTTKPVTQLLPVSIFGIQGVAAPVTGGTPVAAITEATEYSGAVSWSPSDATFKPGTVYTATITLSPKTGYTLTGVAANKFTVAGATATNAANSGVITAVFPATANQAPVITTATLLGGTLNVSYSETLTATGSTPITWSMAGGSLPTGLALNPTTGVISGTPTAAGTFNFKVQASNGTSPDATKDLSIVVGTSAPTVDSVTVSPSTVIVTKGTTQNFTATVTGTNSPAQGVTWEVTGGTGSTIDGSGLLTVTAGETAATLTVKATSTVDTSKSGTATVTVQDAPVTPTVDSVTVAPNTATVTKGTTQSFTATVTGTNNPAQDVTWTVEGANDAGTSITGGTLTVAAGETAATLTVKATSTVDTSKSGTATVTVQNTAPVTPTVDSVTVAPDTATVTKGTTQSFTATVTGTNNPAQDVTWTVEGANDAGTSITGGTLTVAAGETAATLTVRATSTADTSKSGTATVTVQNAAPVTPTVDSVTVAPDTATVTKGAKQSFTATVTGTNSPAQDVTWTVEGSTSPTSATTIAVNGELTVAADETAATLTVKATSIADTSKFGTATVTVNP